MILTGLSNERQFVTIPASEVDSELRRKAVEAGEVGAHRLGIAHVTLRWVLPEAVTTQVVTGTHAAGRHVSPGNWSGWVYSDEPSTIYVRADMPRHVVPTVLHELRHLAQRRDSGALDEEDAEHWAQRLMQLPPYR